VRRRASESSTSRADPLAAGVAEHLPVAPVQAGFRGDDRARAQSGRRQRPTDDFLGAAESVDRRRIDDGDALIQAARIVSIDSFSSLPPHNPAAYGPGADADPRDFE